MDNNERKTLIICFSTDHFSAGSFLRSFKDDNVFLRFDHLHFKKEYQAGECLLNAIIKDLPKYKEENIGKVVLIIDQTVSTYIDEFDSDIFMEVMECCPIKVPTYFFFENKCVSCKYTNLEFPVYFNGFDRDELLARRFVYEFKKKYIIKPHLGEANYYFLNATDYSYMLLKQLTSDTYSPLMQENYHFVENLNVIVENVKKVSALSMIKIDNEITSFEDNSFIFIDNEDLSYSIKVAKEIVLKNPNVYVFIHSNVIRNHISKNIRIVSFYKLGYKYLYNPKFAIEYNHFIDAQAAYPDYLNGLGLFFDLKDNDNFYLSNTDDPYYFFGPYLINAVNFLTKNEVNEVLSEFRKLKNDPKELYLWIVNQYEKDTPLSKLANLEHVRWMMRSLLVLRNFRGKEIYFRPLSDLIRFFNAVSYIDINQQFETDRIIYDYCNALMAILLFKKEK